MGTFFKTFLICMFLAFGFIFYQMMGNNSYSPDLKLSNSMFKISKENNDINTQEVITKEDTQISQIEDETKSEESQTDVTQTKEAKKTYTHYCYFYNKNGQLIKVSRELKIPNSLENALNILLKGPVISETKQGMYSEIPSNVDLISTKKINNKIIINLSANFANDAGIQSVENRLKQLSKTAKIYYPKASIYLYINGKEVEYLGGDGVYIKQPLE